MTRYHSSHRSTHTKWLAFVVTWVHLATLIAGPVPARAATGSLVIAALQTLEREYVDPVHPVDLLNAAIAALRQDTHEDAVALPDIPAEDTEAQADAAFLAEFAHAVQVSGMAETRLAYDATSGMLASLHDTHTYFLDPAQFQENHQQLLGNPGFTGIGIMTTGRADTAGVRYVFVEDVFAGSPAEAVGLKRFDKILQVDATALRNATPAQAAQMIRGPAGSTVVLTVERGGQVLRVPIVRAAIQTHPVKAQWVVPGVAYVRLFEFSRGAAREMSTALASLSAEAPVRSIILDLRGNPGGLVSEAVQVGSLFLPSGTPLARITDRRDGTTLLRTGGPGPYGQTPLVVLTDGGSASASELVTGALKDMHRAQIVGEKTAGALGGAVEEALPEGGMSVTVERITTPQGSVVEGVGIPPDVPVTLSEADMERGNDTPLQAALRMTETVGLRH